MPECQCRECGKQFDAPLQAKHRLLCGDARNREDVDRLFAGAKANVAITSPPYASQRKYDESSDFRPIPPDQYVEWFQDVATNIAAVLAPSGSFFLNLKEHAEDGERSLYVMDLAIAPQAALGLALRGSTLLAQDRQWRAGRLAEQVQKCLGAGLSLHQGRND